MKGNVLEMRCKYGKQSKRNKEPLSVALELLSAILQNDDVSLNLSMLLVDAENWNPRILC